MDMAVANLFKHKISFTSGREYIDLYEPMCFERTLYYETPEIESVESIGLNDVNDLCTILCKPLVLYTLSKIVHEDRVIPIDYVTTMVGVYDLENAGVCYLTRYRFDNPLSFPEFFLTHATVDSCSFPERLLKKRTYICVHVNCCYICSTLREEARFRKEFNYNRYWRHELSIEEYLGSTSFDDEIHVEEGYDSFDEEEYTPPMETYRQDHCVVCLESKPNILYLDCMHIAICDSCDRLKKTGRKNCDVCRAGISKRVKI